MQRQLLDPRKPFHDWAKLLDSRRQIRVLQNLSEEQRDAIQEWRDYRIADLSQAMNARFTDIVEHIERVLNHARTIESQAESAVQLYFAAMSHRTTDIMRLLTLITAIFMPLTLITGIFGMNFEFIPGLHRPLRILDLAGSDGLRRRRHGRVLPPQALAVKGRAAGARPRRFDAAHRGQDAPRSPSYNGRCRGALP